MRTAATILFLVISDFCRVTISGKTSCPGEINGCFLGVQAGVHMSVRSTFISRRKPASVALIDIKPRCFGFLGMKRAGMRDASPPKHYHMCATLKKHLSPKLISITVTSIWM